MFFFMFLLHLSPHHSHRHKLHFEHVPNYSSIECCLYFLKCQSTSKESIEIVFNGHFRNSMKKNLSVVIQQIKLRKKKMLYHIWHGVKDLWWKHWWFYFNFISFFVKNIIWPSHIMTSYKERRNIITLFKQIFMMKEGKSVYQGSESKKKKSQF